MFFKIIILLSLTQITIAIGMIFAEEYLKYLLIQHILDAAQSQTYMLLLLAQVFTFQLLVLNYSSIAVAGKCNRDIFTPHLAFLLKLWVIFGLGCNCQGLFFSFILSKTSVTLPQRIEYELLSGLEEYYSNAEWRLIWDNMQYHENCCGVYDYKDWKSRYLAKLGPHEQHLQSSLSFIPYSCCRNETECFQSVTPLLLSHQRLNVAIIDKQFVNENGCMEKLVHECRHVIYLIVSAIIISFVIHILIVVLLRCLFFYKREFAMAAEEQDEQDEICVKANHDERGQLEEDLEKSCAEKN